MTMNDIQGEQPPVFRRRRSSVPRRRRRVWIRLLKPFSAATLAVGLPVLAVYWVMTAEVFRIGEVSVSGSGRVSVSWVRERLETIAGRHILTLPLADVEAALDGHPWLRGIEISKKLPAHLGVKILERRAVALLNSESELFFVDRSGDLIAPYDPLLNSGDYVVIAADRENRDEIREGVAIAETWSRVAGPWARGLSEVEAVDALSFRLHTSVLDFPLLVTRQHLEQGLQALYVNLPRISREYPTLELADLRFSGQIVFQPAVEPSTEG